MAATEKTVSALIGNQLPEFVRADNPKFRRFLELYYNWLERDGSTANYAYGNTVYHIMNSDKYRDIDTTLDPFIRLFKQEFLPYFPEKTELDLVKILKGAREFYVKKGSEESVKWLFKVLYGEDIEIFLPKKQILIASDGKWKLPKAFDLTISDENANIIPNLLEKHKGTGSISKATCIIESADKTIDKTFGTEVLEIYVSNVIGEFENGENLEIPYIDENGVSQIFVEKIVGSLSGIKLDSNIKTDPQQKRRGLSYNVGDPIVVFGGLADTVRANDAVAVVGNVTMGSIEGVSTLFPGYGYTMYPNTTITVYRHDGDDPNANLSTDIRLAAVTTSVNTAFSNYTFKETLEIDKMPISYLASVTIGTGSQEYVVFTQNNRNIIINATETDKNDIYFTNDFVWANGSSFETANFKAQILTANTSGFGQGGASNFTGGVLLYNVANTLPLTTTGFLVGRPLYTKSAPQKSFTVNSLTNSQLPANVNSQLCQAINHQSIDTGGLSLINVLNGGYGFRQTPTLGINSYFNTYLSDPPLGVTSYHQTVDSYGKIAHVYIDNPGTGYANGDVITMSGYGYDFAGYVNVNTTGSIVRTTIVNRGEGYFGNKTAGIITSGGSGAALTAYGFGEGAVTSVETGAIGRIREIKMISRGYDYITAPVVSFKVVDMVITQILDTESFIEGERVYQGSNLQNAVFQGIVKTYNRDTRTLRLFNYSGASGAAFNATIPFTSEGGVQFSVDQSSLVQPPAALLANDPILDPYRIVRASGGLPNPYFYGNGRAKGIAEFFNGLIKFPGFYVNTDGFLSADKKTQDSKTYHNYSYVIESGISLSEYKNSVMDIAHPSGMTMISRTVTHNDAVAPIQHQPAVYLNKSNPVGSTISVANSQLTTVNGISTTFTTSATANDMLLIIDTVATLRSQAKTITSVTNNTSLIVSSDFCYLGQGRATTNTSSVVKIDGNANTVGLFAAVGDKISFNVAVANTYVAQSGTVSSYTSNVKISGSGTSFTSLAVGDVIRINNQNKQIVNIASATVMNVNSVFSSNTTGQTYSKLLAKIQSTITAIDGNYITISSAVGANASNLVYKICPDYTSNYNYDIITTS